MKYENRTYLSDEQVTCPLIGDNGLSAHPPLKISFVTLGVFTAVYDFLITLFRPSMLYIKQVRKVFFNINPFFVKWYMIRILTYEDPAYLPVMHHN